MVDTRHWLWVGLMAASLSGCFSLRVVPDADDTEPLAHVTGDYRVRAGAPLNLYLRSVDGRPLRMWQHAADIQAGNRRLLVDCNVVETGKLSRHELNVVLEPGVKYRLMAEATPSQGCTSVTLQEVQ